jgi:hypothetical protein
MSATAVCISVIDENLTHTDAVINAADAAWTSFRTNWPDRRLWVLDPQNSSPSSGIYTPAAFQSDPLAFGPIVVARDNGVVANRSDWFAICEIDTLPPGSVVSLAVDTSGSMTLTTVRASYDYFLERCAQEDIFLITNTTFPNERYIPPHDISFAPSAIITASPNPIQRGSNSTLSWTVGGGYTSISINEGIGDVTSEGPTSSRIVSPLTTRQYTVTATSPAGQSTANVTLFVFQPADVNLSADSTTINSGQCTTLRWFTEGDATSATLSPDIGAVNINGNRLVCPTQTTTYRIDVADLGTGDFDTVTVNVNSASQLNAPNPAPVFNTLSNLPLSSSVYSNVVLIQGLTSTATVTAGFNTLIGVSNSNATQTNANGYSVLSNTTFAASRTVSNGQYLQLLGTSSSNQNTTITIDVNIGDASGVSTWTISTGQALSTTPTNFSFPNVTNVAPNIVVQSESRPVGGISGLGTGVSVSVELVSTTGTEPKIKINNGSIGVFPTTVKNGDVITLYNRSSVNFGGNVETEIKVGTRTIVPWSIDTFLSPDSSPTFSPPPNLTNRPPSTSISSAVVGITDFNTPITITATNGALISIDYDTPVAGPRTFTPSNQLIFLVLDTSNQLNTTTTTTVTIGDASPFTWSVTTYATVPPAPSNLSTWYSIKTKKYDGFSIGTVVQVLKENVVSGYGDLRDRFPGFLECDGSSYPVAQYPDLWNIIQNTYGGNGSYNIQTKEYSGTFNVPDYRNKRICGVGIVDANKGGSAFLPVSSGSINQVGSTGGYWYIDRTGIAGPLPLEQVFSGGTTSDFFTLGTVKTFGTENLIGEVNFNIAGSVNAFIGQVGETAVNVPAHDHIFWSSTTESDGGEPLIPWGRRALYASNTIGRENRGRVRSGEEREVNVELFRQIAGSLFISEVDATGLDFDSILPFDSSETVSFGNWWASPLTTLQALAGNRIYDIGGSAANDAGVIDTNLGSMRLNPYSSPGPLITHSHLMSLDAPTNPTTDFTFGNVGGPGTKYSGSLPTANSTLEVTFNQSEVLLELSPATFTFSSAIKPIPTVELSPNKVVPLATPFHKVKYLIKAY